MLCIPYRGTNGTALLSRSNYSVRVARPILRDTSPAIAVHLHRRARVRPAICRCSSHDSALFLRSSDSRYFFFSYDRIGIFFFF